MHYVTDLASLIYIRMRSSKVEIAVAPRAESLDLDHLFIFIILSLESG